jgi:hypothetical protein
MPILQLRSRVGTYISNTVPGETVRAFIPPPLPPVPELDLTGLHQLIEQASQGLGRLNGMTRLLPDIQFLLYLYVRKEALVSSQIEGTQSSFADLLLFENDEVPSVPVEDVEEVSNYEAAMQHGLRRLRGGFPLSLRLIREIHAILLRGGRGAGTCQGNSAGPRTGLGERGPGMPLLFLLRPSDYWNVSTALSDFSMMRGTSSRFSWKPDCARAV